LIRKLPVFMFSLAFSVVAAVAAAPGARADGLSRNWPMPPNQLERRLADEDFTILEVQSAGGGVTVFPPRDLDGWNNSPRKELACYEIQKWFLDENDYVVPTAETHCIPLAAYKPISATPVASVKDTSCVLGIVAVWLSDVDAPEKFWNPERFKADPLFARNMADFNLLTYRVDHRDGRRGNLLVSTDAADPRGFAVDNGIAFGPFPWNFFVPNWNKIRVPWLNHQSVDRLRKVDRAMLDRLGIIVELAPDKDGVLHVVPSGPNMRPSKGVRQASGHVQLGLEREEIDELEKRIRKLLADVDKGRIAVP
jgi:hypothetical protein